MKLARKLQKLHVLFEDNFSGKDVILFFGFDSDSLILLFLLFEVFGSRPHARFISCVFLKKKF